MLSSNRKSIISLSPGRTALTAVLILLALFLFLPAPQTLAATKSSSSKSSAASKSSKRPPVRQISSVSASGTTIKVKWLRTNKKTVGYQLQIARNKAFTRHVGSAWRRKNSRTSTYLTETFKGLRGRKRYYFRLRAYRTADGKKYYSRWSKIMSARTGKAAGTTLAAAGDSLFTQGRLIYRDETYPNVQGLCTDGEKYIYVALRKGANTAEADAQKTCLRKITRDGTVVRSSAAVSYCHANGMTYCSADGRLYIATLGRITNVSEDSPDNDPQQHNVIGVASGKTLKHIRFISLDEQMRQTVGPVWSTQGYGKGHGTQNEKMDCPKISTIYYDAKSDRFICTVTPYRLSADEGVVTYQGIAVFRRDWTLEDYHAYPGQKIYSGNACRFEDVYYLSRNISGTREKVISLMDPSFDLTGSTTIESTTSSELECIDMIGSGSTVEDGPLTMYATFNAGRASVEAFELKRSLLPAPRLTGLSVDTQPDGSAAATLQWSGTDKGRFRIYRKSGSGSFKAVATVNTETADGSYTDTGLRYNKTYTYTVRAYRKGRSSGIDKDGITSLPVPSVNVTFMNIRAKVTWSKVAGATGYRIYRKCLGDWEEIGKAADRSYNDRYRYLDSETKAICREGFKHYLDPSYNQLSYTVRAYKNVKMDGYTRRITGAFLPDGDFCLERPTLVSLEAVSADGGSQAATGAEGDGQAAAGAESISGTSDKAAYILTWGTVPNATAYRILMRTNGKWNIIGDIPAAGSDPTDIPGDVDDPEIVDDDGAAGESTSIPSFPVMSAEVPAGGSRYSVRALAQQNGKTVKSRYETHFYTTYAGHNDKRILFVGDSIMSGSPYYYDDDRDLYTIPLRVAALTSADCTNMDKGGACIHYETITETYKRKSLLTDVIQTIDPADLAGYDTVVLEGGTNDYTVSAPLGEVVEPELNDSENAGSDDSGDAGSDDTVPVRDIGTVCGAFNGMIDCLEDANAIRTAAGLPPMNVILFDIPFANRTTNHTSLANRDTTPNALGLTLVDYQNALNEVWDYRTVLAAAREAEAAEQAGQDDPAQPSTSQSDADPAQTGTIQSDTDPAQTGTIQSDTDPAQTETDQPTALQFFHYRTRSYNIVTADNCSTWTTDNLHMTKKGYAEYGSSLARFMFKNGML